MNILISGGTGLIGSALAETLFSSGHQIGVISRDPSAVDARFSPVSWEESSLLNALSNADAVIHLAGASLAGSNPLTMRWTPNRKESIISSRTSSSAKLLDAIKKLERKPEVFLQASAIGFYGNQGITPADETSPAGSDFLAQVCQAWEGSSAELEAMGIRRLVARIGLVLSPSGGLLPLLALPFRLFIGGKIGSGQQYLSWIDIQDLVKSMQFMIEDPVHQGVFNLTSPNPVSNQDFAAQMGATLGRPSWLPIPGAVLKLALGEAATLALDGRPVYPARLLKAGYSFQFPQLRDSLEHLLR